MGAIVSDGSNIRIKNTSSGNKDIHYRNSHKGVTMYYKLNNEIIIGAFDGANLVIANPHR